MRQFLHEDKKYLSEIVMKAISSCIVCRLKGRKAQKS